MIHITAKHRFLFFLFCMLALALWGFSRLSGRPREASAAATQDNSRVVIVDAGHGGFDGGAVGMSGTLEKDVNLAVAQKLRDMLTEAGYTVVMTRDSDAAVDDDGSGSIRSRKKRDMRARLNLTSLYPGATLVSIHQNKLDGDSRVSGGQVFYSPNRESSRALADLIQQEFNENLQPGKPRETVKTGRNLYLFYRTQNTAVLCECGFLSHPQEEQRLLDDAYRTRLAYCIFRGVVRFLEDDTVPQG